MHYNLCIKFCLLAIVCIIFSVVHSSKTSYEIANRPYERSSLTELSVATFTNIKANDTGKIINKFKADIFVIFCKGNSKVGNIESFRETYHIYGDKKIKVLSKFVAEDTVMIQDVPESLVCYFKVNSLTIALVAVAVDSITADSENVRSFVSGLLDSGMQVLLSLNGGKGTYSMTESYYSSGLELGLEVINATNQALLYGGSLTSRLLSRKVLSFRKQKIPIVTFNTSCAFGDEFDCRTQMGQLTVATFNPLWLYSDVDKILDSSLAFKRGGENLIEYFKEVARIIDEVDADVMMFQEVEDLATLLEVLKYLIKNAGKYKAYVMDYEGDMNVAMITKVSFFDEPKKLFPNNGRGMFARLLVDERKIALINVHLYSNYSGEDAQTKRMKQLIRIGKTIGLLTDDDFHPILAGDFNMSEAEINFSGLLDLVNPKARFYYQKYGFTHSMPYPKAQKKVDETNEKMLKSSFDHIYCDSAFELLISEFIIFNGRPQRRKRGKNIYYINGISQVSDHLPLVARFQLAEDGEWMGRDDSSTTEEEPKYLPNPSPDVNQEEEEEQKVEEKPKRNNRRRKNKKKKIVKEIPTSPLELQTHILKNLSTIWQNLRTGKYNSLQRVHDQKILFDILVTSNLGDEDKASQIGTEFDYLVSLAESIGKSKNKKQNKLATQIAASYFSAIMSGVRQLKFRGETDSELVIPVIEEIENVDEEVCEEGRTMLIDLNYTLNIEDDILQKYVASTKSQVELDLKRVKTELLEALGELRASLEINDFAVMEQITKILGLNKELEMMQGNKGSLKTRIISNISKIMKNLAQQVGKLPKLPITLVALGEDNINSSASFFISQLQKIEEFLEDLLVDREEWTQHFFMTMRYLFSRLDRSALMVKVMFYNKPEGGFSRKGEMAEFFPLVDEVIEGTRDYLVSINNELEEQTIESGWHRATHICLPIFLKFYDLCRSERPLIWEDLNASEHTLDLFRDVLTTTVMQALINDKSWKGNWNKLKQKMTIIQEQLSPENVTLHNKLFDAYTLCLDVFRRVRRVGDERARMHELTEAMLLLLNHRLDQLCVDGNLLRTRKFWYFLDLTGIVLDIVYITKTIRDRLKPVSPDDQVYLLRHYAIVLRCEELLAIIDPTVKYIH